jgi:DNA-binding transcriptional ArsR family regulator
VPTNRADAWTALGDPSRKAVFELLVDRPRAVVDLARDLPISRPAVSQHLRVLRDAGLVHEVRAGTRRIYSADAKALGELRAAIDEMWRAALGEFAATVNQKERRKEKRS